MVHCDTPSVCVCVCVCVRACVRACVCAHKHMHAGVVCKVALPFTDLTLTTAAGPTFGAGPYHASSHSWGCESDR